MIWDQIFFPSLVLTDFNFSFVAIQTKAAQSKTSRSEKLCSDVMKSWQHCCLLLFLWHTDACSEIATLTPN